jgi:hypothetical protein
MMNSRNKNIIRILIAGFFLSFFFCPAGAEVYIWSAANGVRYVSNIRPDWWTDEMDLEMPGTVMAPESDEFPGIFIGDRENLKFHWPRCIQIYNPDGKLAIPPEKRMWFNSYQDAINKGFYECDHCKPSENGQEYQPKTP